MTVSTLSRNRWVAAAQLGFANPLGAFSYVLSRAAGRRSRHRLRIGDLELLVRAQGPDLKVVRSCLLGEFDEALDLAGPDPRLIIDAGGYIGVTSALFAQRYPGARVICLEPNSENAAIARQNMADFANVEVIEAALATSTDTAWLSDRGSGQWSFTITDLGDETRHLHEVRVTSLPELLKCTGYGRIDFLKLDIEGSEFELFEDAETWLHLVDVVAVELHERFRPGVTELYERTMAGRRHLMSGKAEKRITVAKRRPASAG